MRPELRQLVEAIEAVEAGATKGAGSVGGNGINVGTPQLTSGQSCAVLSQFSNARKMGVVAIPTGWAEIDEVLRGGLGRSAIHEWFGMGMNTQNASQRSAVAGSVRGRWFPPLAILIHLASRSLAHDFDSGASKLVVWIGRRCWPCHLAMGQKSEVRSQGPSVPSSLRASVPSLLHLSLFLDPPDEASRLWAIDVALRSPAVSVVVADGSNLQMAHTRRLQLAAEAGGTLGLFARPPWEIALLSAARTRWAVSVNWEHECRRSALAGDEEEVKRRKGEEVRETAMPSSSSHLFTSSSFHPIASESSSSTNPSVPSLPHDCASVPSCLRASVPDSFDVSTFRRFDVSFAPRWRIELLRCKGVRPASGPGREDVHTRTRAWTLEYDRAESGVHLSADVADRSDPAAAA